MTIRSTLTEIVKARGADPGEAARMIIGFLSCECCLDNGNGWYDDDPHMADGGLGEAEALWLAQKPAGLI